MIQSKPTGKPKRINFTKAGTANLPVPESGRTYYYDSKTAGLAVCVTSTGLRTFYLCGKRVKGRPVRVLLGRLPTMTVEQARKKAAKLVGEIVEGKDPAGPTRELRREATLGELFLWYLESYAKPHKRSWKGDQWQYDKYLAHWKNRKLSAIEKSDVVELHVKLGKSSGPYTANRVLALLSAMFNRAIDDKGWKGSNPAKGVERFVEQERDRFLQPDELPKFFNALNREPDESLREFFMLALLTGARRGNVLSMRWEEIHFHRNVWVIPASKTKGKAPIDIPLSAECVAILKRRRTSTTGSDWVFPSHGKTGHIIDIKSAWNRICKAAGLKDLRPHDLRRSLGSWMAAGGASLPIIGKTLGHQDASTTAIYARLQLDPVRHAVETATTAIMAAARPKPKKNRRRGGGNGQT